MKPVFNLFFILLLFLWGCGENPVVSSSNPSLPSEPKWICISLMPSEGSRSSESFVIGSEKEHKINSLILYFFDSTGKTFPVGENQESFILLNSLDAITPSNSPDNVEAIVKTSIKLKFNNSGYPSNVIAIANPTDLILGKLINSVKDLQKIQDDFEDTESLGFVMSNSIYKNSSGEKIFATPITSADIFSSEEEAATNPVNIIIERVVAKVAVVATNTLSYDENPVYKADGKDSKDNDIYIKLLGWNVTSRSDKSRLLKEINEEWRSDLFDTGNNWNDFNNFRCYWAINAEGIDYKFVNFIDLSEENFEAETERSGYIKTFSDTEDYLNNHFYVNENAARNIEGENPEEPTKIIVAAQLIDSEGTPADYAEYGGKKFTKDGILAEIVKEFSYYKQIVNEQSATTWEHISQDDIELGANTDPENPSYLVTAKLKDMNSDWYLNADESQKIDNYHINQQLHNLCQKNRAKVWNNGFTYYYADITHSGGEDKGSIGVVRNTYYRISITNITGLGTPVFDPDKIIIPEETEETSLIINVKMMDWKLLKQELDIAW